MTKDEINERLRDVIASRLEQLPRYLRGPFPDGSIAEMTSEKEIQDAVEQMIIFFGKKERASDERLTAMLTI
jgi:hypothetical protein